MPRIRSVKPELWTDSKVVALSLPARLMFIGSWNYADDFGCLPADAMQLKLRVLPADPVDAHEVVQELLDGGLLEVLESSGGVQFWHVTHWDRHQKVSHPTPSDFGAPETWRKPMTRENAQSSDSLPRIPEDSGALMGDGKGVEGRGGERNGSSAALAAPEDSGEVEERERDPWYDATVAALDMPERNDEEGLIGSIAAKARNGGHPPGEILNRAALHLATFNFPLTPGSLKKRWDQLGSKVVTATPTERKRVQAELERMRQREQIITAAGGGP